MGHEIHARLRKTGMFYRVWSNGINMYLTKPLSVEKLRETLFASYIIKHINREIDNAMIEGKTGEILNIEDIFLVYQNRWIKEGELDSKEFLHENWQKQNKPPFSSSKEEEEEHERRNKLIKKVLRYLLRNM